MQYKGNRKKSKKENNKKKIKKQPGTMKDLTFWRTLDFGLLVKKLLCSTQQMYSSTDNLCHKLVLDYFLFTKKPEHVDFQ